MPEQIFNRDETSLGWKQMSKRTSSLRRPSQCQVSRLLRPEQQPCLGAVLWDRNGNPLRSGRVRTPVPAGVVSKHKLPLGYGSKKGSRMARPLLPDALLNCYASEMRKCCLEKDVPLKILLIVASAPDILPLLVISVLVSKWCFSL